MTEKKRLRFTWWRCDGACLYSVGVSPKEDVPVCPMCGQALVKDR